MAKSRAKPARTQSQRSEATRGELVAAARELFAQDGYAATLLDAVARRAGVTKGALYHHFAGKRELFEAVFEEEERRLSEIGVRAFERQHGEASGFYEACRAFLEASLDPAVQRISLLDGPAVLGWERVREIEDRHSMANLRLGFEMAVVEGRIAPRPIEPLVQILRGALCESALFIARSSDPRVTLREVLEELRVLLDALIEGPRQEKTARKRRTSGA
jgi:AcrR family transcriptional regulator